MIIQIYEIQEPRQAELCMALGVDHIGSVLLSEEGWRQPCVKDVMLLSEGTKVKTSLIPLFESMDSLERSVDYYRPDYLHFCGSLTDHQGGPVDLQCIIQFQGILKEKFPEIGIIRSIPVPRAGMFHGFPAVELAQTLAPASDLFLIDTWIEQEPVKGFIGITGMPADWDVSRDLVGQSTIPVILAGGLSPENVFEALLKVCPYGADTCTHTNKVNPDGTVVRFQKDAKKVKQFVQEVRRAEKVIRDKRQGLRERLATLEGELREREAAVPAHSVTPHQIVAIESLEQEISLIKEELRGFGE